MRCSVSNSVGPINSGKMIESVAAGTTGSISLSHRESSVARRANLLKDCWAFDMGTNLGKDQLRLEKEETEKTEN